MDPTLIVSGISAVLKAIDTWIKYQDSRRAARDFEARIGQAPHDPAIQREAQILKGLVPQPILDTMGSRVQQCWERYHDVLKGGYLPGEINEATNALKACICRELTRLHDLNGSIPPGQLSEWWKAYCKS